MSETLFAAYIGLGASVLVAIVALFQKQLRAGMFGPRLEICYDRGSRTDAHVTTAIAEQLGNTIRYRDFYVRLRIANAGRTAARNVEVIARNLRVQDPSTGVFVEDPTFLQLNLKWSHTGSVVQEQIPAGIEKPCDFFHIPDPTVSLEGFVFDPPPAPAAILELEVHPNVNPGILRPGAYRLGLVAAGSNCEPTRVDIQFSIPTTWIDDDGQMTRLVDLRGLTARSTILESVA